MLKRKENVESRIMKTIKIIIRALTELSAIVYPYEIFIKLINAKDELTIINVILMIIYAIISINIFEWAWSDE